MTNRLISNMVDPDYVHDHAMSDYANTYTPYPTPTHSPPASNLNRNRRHCCPCCYKRRDPSYYLLAALLTLVSSLTIAMFIYIMVTVSRLFPHSSTIGPTPSVDMIRIAADVSHVIGINGAGTSNIIANMTGNGSHVGTLGARISANSVPAFTTTTIFSTITTAAAIASSTTMPVPDPTSIYAPLTTILQPTPTVSVGVIVAICFAVVCGLLLFFALMALCAYCLARRLEKQMSCARAGENRFLDRGLEDFIIEIPIVPDVGQEHECEMGDLQSGGHGVRDQTAGTQVAETHPAGTHPDETHIGEDHDMGNTPPHIFQ